MAVGCKLLSCLKCVVSKIANLHTAKIMFILHLFSTCQPQDAKAYFSYLAKNPEARDFVVSFMANP